MPFNTTVALLDTLCVTKHFIPAHGRLPNSSILNKPLLVYRSAFIKGDACAVESHLLSVGVVIPQWRYSMYSTTHFHSTSHEVLCVTSGRAKLCFGGEENPDRVTPIVQAGDVMIVPAGMAHRLLEDMSGTNGGFEMVGSYPKGYHWDMCYGLPEDDEKINSIKSLPWFQKDPIFDEYGPVLDV
ncbi:hypothetical protein N0V93_006994 [Gnomoniopsis smithogilvyi]|uniref:Cupin type-1 domain-containing protein n=1 Tax=Gnomoniopsis smithogilvyi TaxID=1191159 RepID=A0A9W9CV88_9PEZI|nr:hypothetical protein N0V93_006994 [Gnomoniopsis smithogilvyi]